MDSRRVQAEKEGMGKGERKDGGCCRRVGVDGLWVAAVELISAKAGQGGKAQKRRAGFSGRAFCKSVLDGRPGGDGGQRISQGLARVGGGDAFSGGMGEGRKDWLWAQRADTRDTG